MTEIHPEDLRTPLQREEEAQAAAFAALPKAAKVTRLLDDVLAKLRHQVKHNAPVTESILSDIEAVRALVG
jgi:hypothetical protein